MERLPDEVIIEVLRCLEAPDLAHVRLVCRRHARLAHDRSLWKRLCFKHTRSEQQRIQQERLDLQEASLVAIRRALHTSNLAVTSRSHMQNETPDPAHINRANEAERQVLAEQRAFMVWDPSYPGERVDYFREYVERHSKITTTWLQSAHESHAMTKTEVESLGLATLRSGSTGQAQKLVAPLSDGSVGIWNVSSDCDGMMGRIEARSAPNLLQDLGTASDTITSGFRETSATETVSIRNDRQTAYFAVHDCLNEVDLRTLQLVRRQKFPFQISALSEAVGSVPLTVGTTSTLHLYDTRQNFTFRDVGYTTRVELIGGKRSIDRAPLAGGHVNLSQPSPLSILHLSSASSPSTVESGDIWVAGRFTSLLAYDRRMWPKTRTSLFSGARISSISTLDYPYVSRPNTHADWSCTSELLQTQKSRPGAITILAAGEYKGKGSLELHGLESSIPNSSYPSGFAYVGRSYLNRQTAARSRLLSVQPHGARIVFSDADGNMRWVERNGFSHVAGFNINDAIRPRQEFPETSLFPGTQHDADAEEQGDVVQKIVPMKLAQTMSLDSTTAASGAEGVMNVYDNDLLIWTGDGRLGLVGFGHRDPCVSFEDGVEEEQDIEDRARAEVERQQRREESVYGQRMREALVRQADEARFVRNLW